MIDPFANDHQSMQIGQLIIENQQDKIIIYGDLDLTLDTIGREQARQLHELISKIIQVFDKKTDRVDDDMIKEVKIVENKENVDNPFM